MYIMMFLVAALFCLVAYVTYNCLFDNFWGTGPCNSKPGSELRSKPAQKSPSGSDSRRTNPTHR